MVPVLGLKKGALSQVEYNGFLRFDAHLGMTPANLLKPGMRADPYSLLVFKTGVEGLGFEPLLLAHSLQL